MSSWVSFILLVSLCFSFNGVSGARHLKKHHSAAILTGTVYCDTCFRQEVPKSTHFISGATVAVECGGDGVKPRFHEEVKTNEKGEFEVKLPAYVGKHVEKIKACSVRLISSNEPNCAVAASATTSDIRFKSKKGGTHVFSAGFFTFKPQLCNEKNLVEKDFPPSLPVPRLPPGEGGMLPPLPVPDLPIPVPPLVPPLPQIPGVPLPPLSRKKPSKENTLSDQKIFGFPFPPNPFQPPVLPPLPLVPSPPSIIPPLPFQPPPPSLLPPVFPSPPPAPMFPPLPQLPPLPSLPPVPFPPVPSLIPSPPPPPPPVFPIPLPPLIPGFPPVPPASTSQHVGKTTP